MRMDGPVADASLDVFRSVLSHECRAQSGTPIPSSTAAQASIVVETFFLHAKHTVRIATGSLNEKIYGTDDVLAAAANFLLYRERKLQILFLEGRNKISLETHSLIRRFAGSNRLQMKVIPENSSLTSRPHFMLMDDIGYRFKASGLSHSSIVAFGDNVTTSRLNEIFEMVWDNSPEFSLLMAA